MLNKWELRGPNWNYYHSAGNRSVWFCNGVRGYMVSRSLRGVVGYNKGYKGGPWWWRCLTESVGQRQQENKDLFSHFLSFIFPYLNVLELYWANNRNFSFSCTSIWNLHLTYICLTFDLYLILIIKKYIRIFVIR